jgi:hypothetical protein|tara:strand:+ start:10155 stop:10259 length:105 start_codon:yes stop_codon:yes gene_type:complete
MRDIEEENQNGKSLRDDGAGAKSRSHRTAYIPSY